MIEEETKEVKEASSNSSSDKNLTTEKIEKLEKQEIKEEQKQEELKTDQSIPVIKIKNLQAASSLQYPNTLTNKMSPAEGKQQDKGSPSRHKTQLP